MTGTIANDPGTAQPAKAVALGGSGGITSVEKPVTVHRFRRAGKNRGQVTYFAASTDGEQGRRAEIGELSPVFPRNE
jgi:hypothetical protein